MHRCAPIGQAYISPAGIPRVSPRHDQPSPFPLSGMAHRPCLCPHRAGLTGPSCVHTEQPACSARCCCCQAPIARQWSCQPGAGLTAAPLQPRAGARARALRRGAYSAALRFRGHWPGVQGGSSGASQVPRWASKLWTDHDRSDMVAVGTAAGVAAAFRSPVGG